MGGVGAHKLAHRTAFKINAICANLYEKDGASGRTSNELAGIPSPHEPLLVDPLARHRADAEALSA